MTVGLVSLGRRTVTGKVLMGGFDNALPTYAFANLLKAMLDIVPDTSGYAFPAILDSNGFPNNAPSNTLPTNLRMPINIPSSWGNQTLVLKWKGTMTAAMLPADLSNLVTTGTNSSVFPTFLNISGTDVRTTFNFTTAPDPAANYVFVFGTGTFANVHDVVLCRLSDEAAIDANPNAFNPDFLNQQIYARPKTLRPLDWSGVFGHQSRLSYRAPLGAASFFGTRYPPEIWCGSASGTGTSIDPYVCSLPPNWTSLVDGAAITVQFTNTNSGSVPVLQLPGTGKITLTTLDPSNFNANDISAQSIWTFVYSSVYGRWAGQTGGFAQRAPIEIHCALANAVNSHLWYNIPIQYSPADCTALAALVKPLLNSWLRAYFEFGNEVWNSNGKITSFIENLGLTFGFASDPGQIRQRDGAYGLLVRRSMEAITTGWGGKDARLRRVFAVQAYGDASLGGSTNVYRMQGTDLAPVSAGGPGNATYVAYTGNANYTAVGNRPCDWCDVFSFATYWAGANILQFDQSYIDAFNAGLNFNSFVSAADSFTAGGAGIATAMAWVDNDLRAGANSAGSQSGNGTLLDFSSNRYPAWETFVASYDTIRAGLGLAPFDVECYEGGPSMIGMTTTVCTALGISTTKSAEMGAMLEFYKNSAAFTTIVTDQYNQFLSTSFPHFKTPAQYITQGASPWSLFTGDTYSGPPFGAAYKSWDAFVAYNRP